MSTPAPNVAVREKTGAALLSVASNSILIALKLAAGAITGSIAIITEALHSSIDLMASVIALVSVRKAGEPADTDHPYGHEKLENLAAAIEGMLILVGAGIVIFEAVRRLGSEPELKHLGVGMGVIAFSVLANVLVSTYIGRQAAKHDSAALEGDAAHLRADAMTSFGVLIGLLVVDATGTAELDAVIALVVAAAIVYSGLRILTRSSRVLVDEVLPDEELTRIDLAIARARTPEVKGYHKLRARRAGSRRHIDLHLQFATGTTLEQAHATAHAVQDAIEIELSKADVLIHVEPESSARPPGPEEGHSWRW